MIEVNCSNCGEPRSYEDRMQHLGTLCPKCRQETGDKLLAPEVPGQTKNSRMSRTKEGIAILAISIAAAISLTALVPPLAQLSDMLSPARIVAIVIFAVLIFVSVKWFLQWRSHTSPNFRHVRTLDFMQDTALWTKAMLAVGAGLIILLPVAIDHQIGAALLFGAWIAIVALFVEFRAHAIGGERGERISRTLRTLGGTAKIVFAACMVVLAICLIWALWVGK